MTETKKTSSKTPVDTTATDREERAIAIATRRDRQPGADRPEEG